jgi:hypothetical protein
VANVCLTSFWIGKWPHTYHFFWLVKDIVLFSLSEPARLRAELAL